MQGFVEPPGWSTRTGAGRMAPMESHGQSEPLPMYPVLCLSSTCLFLSCVLCHKQGIVSKVLLGVVWAILANYQIPIRDCGNPWFTTGWVGAQVTTWTCHWHPEWEGSYVGMTSVARGSAYPELSMRELSVGYSGGICFYGRKPPLSGSQKCSVVSSRAESTESFPFRDHVAADHW